MRHPEYSSTETMDNNLGKQLHDKEEELQQLRTEIQSYVGKLKGYQTLGKFSVADPFDIRNAFELLLVISSNFGLICHCFGDVYCK